MGRLDQILDGLLLGSVATITGISVYYNIKKEKKKDDTNTQHKADQN